LGAALAVSLAGPALADGPKPPPAKFAVTVVRASTEPGKIDPDARRLNDLLARKGLRFGSLEVLEKRNETLKLGQIGSVDTPNGRSYRFRPVDRNEQGFLVSVDWGTSHGDIRMREGVPFILGGQPHEGGQLVVVLEVR
jgi:hypothetical protein